MLLLFAILVAEWPPVWERAVHSVSVRVFRKRLSNSVCILFSLFGIEGGMWDVIVLIPDHCLSIYFIDMFIFH